MEDAGIVDVIRNVSEFDEIRLIWEGADGRLRDETGRIRIPSWAARDESMIVNFYIPDLTATFTPVPVRQIRQITLTIEDEAIWPLEDAQSP